MNCHCSDYIIKAIQKSSLNRIPSIHQARFFYLIAAIFVSVFSMAEAKIMIYAHYFGQPEYVKYQALFFEKNLLDEYEFVVFEDSPDLEVSAQIENECGKYNVRYIHIPRSAFDEPVLPLLNSYVGLHSPSFECCVATQYIYDNYVVPSQDICAILDNDIFLLSPFSIEQFLGNASFAYRPQHRDEVTYMLPNFMIFNPSAMLDKELLNFNMGNILGQNTDSGGCTHYYLQNHFSEGNVIHKYDLYALSSKDSVLKGRFKDRCPLLFDSQEWGSHYFICPDTFLHIRMGSNWSNHPKYLDMRKELNLFFSELLQLYRAREGS